VASIIVLIFAQLKGAKVPKPVAILAAFLIQLTGILA
jgi:hypothetical protein